MTQTTVNTVQRLSQESSYFLRQQARQPVEWYPWGEVAFQTAGEQGKPVLLSIGHGTSHWCHRMADESFSDPLVASVLNHRFIAIKVDRDQRPDIDRAYQAALQALTQEGGGWPLTVFLTPHDRMPFFGGTYFPATASATMPGFADVLTRIADYYEQSAASIQSQTEQLRGLLSASTRAGRAPLGSSQETVQQARIELEQKFDGQFGGFGGAPKFPQAGLCERLLRTWESSQHQPIPDLQALYMASLTMTRMAESGINDLIRGGFFRYSTDLYWRIPCYEKTLTDNALLLALYAQAAIATGDPLFASTATTTGDWLLGDLRNDDGSFSAGHVGVPTTDPGASYVWDRDRIAACLDPDDDAAFAIRFGLSKTPNTGDGRWHLHAERSLEETAQALGITRGDAESRLARGVAALRNAREPRIGVLRDDTVLTAANALAVRGLAVAARAIGRADYAEAAAAALDCLRRNVWSDGRLRTSYSRYGIGVDGYLDDYAYLLDATLELLATHWRADDLDFAIALADAIQSRFVDSRDGSLWFTAEDAEHLIVRPKSFADDSVPSGNGVAARALNRLGLLIGKGHYCDVAQAVLEAATPHLQRRPAAHATLLDALEEFSRPLEQVVLRGPEDAVRQWHRELSRLYAPQRMVYAIATGTDALPPRLRALPETPDAVAYVSRGLQEPEAFRTFPALIHRLRDGIELTEF